MPEILYFNGRRVAMGDDLEPVPLFESAKPGDKVTVAVKLLHHKKIDEPFVLSVFDRVVAGTLAQDAAAKGYPLK
jgi:alpha-mannosidase